MFGKAAVSFFVGLGLLINSPKALDACTGMQLKAKDGSVVNGRTVEFGVKIDLQVLFVPRGYEFVGELPDGGKGIKYKAKYAAIGTEMANEPLLADGVNEKGLAVGAFYFQGYTEYAKITRKNRHRAMSPLDFPNWIVTQFATVDEVKKAVQDVAIAPTVLKAWGFTPPFHYVVYDRTGNSIVIEPTDGKLKVFENPLGILTNSPTFDWQMTNLRNYVNFTPFTVPPITVEGVKIAPLAGSGMHGLPGDFTPPSRFVRIAAFSSAALAPENADAAVLQTFHILNQFDIPLGSVRGKEGNLETTDYTMLTVVRDVQSGRYYFKTYDDQDLKVVDLKAFDFDGKELKTVSMAGEQTYTDVSPRSQTRGGSLVQKGRRMAGRWASPRSLPSTGKPMAGRR